MKGGGQKEEVLVMMGPKVSGDPGTVHCCNCEAMPATIRGAKWVRLCPLHAAAPDLLAACTKAQP